MLNFHGKKLYPYWLKMLCFDQIKFLFLLNKWSFRSISQQAFSLICLSCSCFVELTTSFDASRETCNNGGSYLRFLCQWIFVLWHWLRSRIHNEYFSKIKFSFYRWLLFLSQRCLGFFFSLIFPNGRKREFHNCRLDFLKRLLPSFSIKRAAKFFCLYFNDLLICIHTCTVLSIFTT